MKDSGVNQAARRTAVSENPRPAVTNPLAQEEFQNWKMHNNYERKDHFFKTKEVLKDEITNIAMRIVKAREAKSNMVYNHDTGKLHGTWKVPEVELMTKNTDESNRYYNYSNNFKDARKTGLKFVPPPVGMEHSLEHLRDEVA